MGEKEFNTWIDSLGISLKLQPINKELKKVDQAEMDLIDIRSTNDLSKKEVDGFDKNNYEGKWVELKKPLFGKDSISSKLVRYNFNVQGDIDAYYEAYTKYDNQIYSAIRYCRELRIKINTEIERINSGVELPTNQEKIPEQIQDKDSIRKLNDSEIKNEGKKVKSNKGITKRIEKLIETLELKKSEKSTDEICNDVCKILGNENFEPNWRSVYSILNKKGINNERLKTK